MATEGLPSQSHGTWSQTTGVAVVYMSLGLSCFGHSINLCLCGRVPRRRTWRFLRSGLGCVSD